MKQINQTSPRWNQVLNKHCSEKKISLTPDGFTVKFYKTHGKEVTSILYTLFQKAKMEGIIHNSFYEASITHKTKTRQIVEGKKKHKERKKKKTTQTNSLLSCWWKIKNKIK